MSPPIFEDEAAVNDFIDVTLGQPAALATSPATPFAIRMYAKRGRFDLVNTNIAYFWRNLSMSQKEIILSAYAALRLS